jgi:hypothetical protein
VTRRRVLLLGAAASLLLATGVVVLHVASRQPGVSLRNFEAIREGATRKEVEQLMGGPGVVRRRPYGSEMLGFSTNGL